MDPTDINTGPLAASGQIKIELESGILTSRMIPFSRWLLLDEERDGALPLPPGMEG